MLEMLKIKFIEHSSFLVETQDVYLLFDYCFRDRTEQVELKNDGKPLYVLNSHAHSDHYAPVIFDLQKNLTSNGLLDCFDKSKKTIINSIQI